ncbi:two-component system sensor histidine kinase YesM [Paenibacillus sp. JGP012]|uniref:cache domain-containing sensor histidine kinase n=1 Tax=Paenibacillus sp. JGP012 TaxID=2735914 RepID=UPI00161693A3|nr:sensor histidine kinase [Paenibacillus sp. JGP012]MBB6023502.1 two-component system sensor histidine kinase YesM [Paenibacillus sp. JGP012]
MNWRAFTGPSKSIANKLRIYVRSSRVSSIRSIITWSFSVFIVLVLTIMAVLLHDKFTQAAERSAELSTRQIVDQVSYNLEDYVRSMSHLYRAIEEHMLRDGTWEGDQVDKQLDTLLSSREDIISITLLDANGQLLKNRPAAALKRSAHVTQQGWFQSALRVPNHLSFSLPHIQNMYAGPYQWVVSMSKGMKMKQNGQERQVILLVDINFKQMDEISSRVSLGQRGYVYIIDESAGNIVYHPQQQLMYMGLKKENIEQALVAAGSYEDEAEGQKRLNTVKSVANIGWKIVGVAYLDEIMTTRQEVNGYLIRVLVVVLVLVIVVSLLLSSSLTRPIRRMERKMKAVERGDFNVELPTTGPLEVERLSRRFNLMVNKIRTLMDEIIHEQEQKRRLELEALQAQINPHFLYNTLNSVVRMVGMSRNDEVITMITSLSRLFRISLSQGKTIISVREELEHARHYLTIQQMRFKHKFTFTIHADEQVLDGLTLKLILQPLIENAIVHGIEYHMDEGSIEIDVQRDEQDVVFRITDNGVGMSEEQMAALLGGRTVVKSGAGSGVAVRNVHDRIRLYYGEGYGLNYASELEEGTTVWIRIPFQQAQKEDGANEGQQ